MTRNYEHLSATHDPFLRHDIDGLSREGYFLADPAALRSQVLRFLEPRPSLAYSDTNFPLMVSFMIAELHEAEVEENRPNGEFTHLDLQKELIDVIFFIESFAHGNQIEFDNRRIVSILNGSIKNYSRRSTIYDQMREHTGNMRFDYKNAKQGLRLELETLLGFLYAKLYQLPEPTDPAQIMAKVMAKNERNYPAEYFGSWDDGLQRELRGDELQAKYRHASRCLRTIRTASGNCLEGLTPAYHQPFARLINDWQHSERALNQLKLELQSETWQLIFKGDIENTKSGLSVVGRPNQAKTTSVRPTAQHSGIIYARG